VWMLIGVFIYAGYGHRNSVLAGRAAAVDGVQLGNNAI